ncbi:hypothetical protein [Streptomyces albidoflavus]|uniref:hypothetical protein n=1 Tax=Streptomyces albidoflavus TaxID=1886 RepID=UPI0010226DD0|nr:hypothetical protein [Streptomyces albidoflavus]
MPGLELSPAHHPALRGLVEHRHALQQRYPPPDRTAEQQQVIDEVAHQINRLSMAEPARPTWIGDRIAAVEQISVDRYGLGLRFDWPRLWLVLPEHVQAEHAQASSQFAPAVVTGAWTLPYLVPGALWWPALLIASVTCLSAWARARTAIAELTNLSESTTVSSPSRSAPHLPTVPAPLPQLKAKKSPGRYAKAGDG